MATFAERLKIALQNKNMKQSVLAYRIGVDRSYISNWLSGKYEAKTETQNQIANILGVSSAWLAGYDVPMCESVETDSHTKLDQDVIIYHRNGKTEQRHFTESQMKILLAMIDAVSEESKN